MTSATALMVGDLSSSDAEAAGREQSGGGRGGRGAIPKSGRATLEDNWVEPWEWRPSDWPGQQLHLNLVKHAAPKAVFGDTDTGDVQSFLFSYNGTSPGPTIRLKGNETLFLKVRNLLGPNLKDYCLPGHTNGKHQEHTTNLHTHGLHIEPGRNPDGTFSDNVFLRVIPQGDYDLRRATRDPNCWPLKGNEVVGEANFAFKLGELDEVHPPGTHWYHPQSHGATFTQVASRMAGFLIVEGDVDEALEKHFNPHPEDPSRVGTYRERLILVQRVVAPKPTDPEGFRSADGVQRVKSQLAFPAINGESPGQRVMVMRPGAVERWRVLNGSVDGRGYIEFMVVEGDAPKEDVLRDPSKRHELRHLAMDGITLVANEAAPRYTTRPLRPLIMAPANRADFLFKAPRLNGADQKVFTVVAKYYPDAADEDAFKRQRDPDYEPLADVTIATLVVREANPSPNGDESEGAAEIAFAPPGFPDGLNNGIFVGFHGQFNLAGLDNEENPLVYVDLDTLDYFHFIGVGEPGIGHLDGLLSAGNSLFIADLSSNGSMGNGAGSGVIYQITNNVPEPSIVGFSLLGLAATIGLRLLRRGWKGNGRVTHP